MIKTASRRRFLLHSLAPTTLILLTGCAATLNGLPAGDGERLIERAKAYWQSMQANDRLATWKYEVASKDQSVALDAYLKRGGIVYDAVEVRGINQMEGDAAQLDLWMRYSVPLARIKRKEVVMRDRWRRIDGEWFHELPHNPLLNVTK